MPIGLMIFTRLLAAVAALFLCLGTAFAAPGEPLSAADEKRYRAIFAAQEAGKLQAADAEIAKLQNKVLLGYVLEQRYLHPTAYRSTYAELKRWMSAYADYPTAGRIYKLALRKKGRDLPPRQPQSRPWRTNTALDMHPELESDYENAADSAKVRRIERTLRTYTRRGDAQQALNFLNAPQNFNTLTKAQTDRVRGWIAASFYYEGELTKARDVANQALERSWDQAVLSHWIAGLVAWRQDDADTAYKHFAAQAAIEFQEPSMRAEAAYWAARAALCTGKVEAIAGHLELAATTPLSLYGQLALAQLGRADGIAWEPRALTAADWTHLTRSSSRIERAAALAQVGLIDRAEAELTWAQAELSFDDDEALAAFANHAGLPSASLLIGRHAGAELGRAAGLESALFPDPPYAPQDAERIDRALLLALARQESKFLVGARSGSGAVGLMQLMPRTASYIANGKDGPTGLESGKLTDPAYNMSLGQAYVEALLTRYNGGSGDLFEMTLSYNWGPGNFNRWKADSGITDPLLMIESVPDIQARGFVEKVMTNFWVYRARLGETAPSRDAVAAGGSPIYTSVR